MALQADESPELFSWLSDDLLLGVFSYLSNGELLLARGVCLRWREVAMDRWAWSHRELTLGGGGRLQKAILLKAPCVGRLSIDTDYSWDEFESVPSPLPLGYSNLVVTLTSWNMHYLERELLRRHNAVVEHNVLVLKHLDVSSLLAVYYRPLLNAINDCNLESLRVQGELWPRRRPDNIDLLDQMPRGQASLKTLECHGLKGFPEPAVDLLVTMHAATLTKLSLSGPGVPSFGPVPLSVLSQCTALTHLTCYPMHGMEALHLPSLEHLHLLITDRTPEYHFGVASEFVHQAAQLRRLEVEMLKNETSENVSMFLQHLSRTPGRPAALQTMHVVVRRHDKRTVESWMQLADAITCLMLSWRATMSLEVRDSLVLQHREIIVYDDAQDPVCCDDHCLYSKYGGEKREKCCTHYKWRGWRQGPPEHLSVVLRAAVFLRSLLYPVCSLDEPLLHCPAHPRCRFHPWFVDSPRLLQERCERLASRVDCLRRAVCDNACLHLLAARWVCVGRGKDCDWWRQHAPHELRNVPHGRFFHMYGHTGADRCDAHRGGELWVKLDDALIDFSD